MKRLRQVLSVLLLLFVVIIGGMTYFGPLAPVAGGVVTFLVQQRAGYTPAKLRPIDAAARLNLPVLIGHGDADGFVTPEQARELFLAVPAGRKLFLNIPGAGHGNVLITEAPVYATVSGFFLGALPQPVASRGR